MISLFINGRVETTDAAPDTVLLWVIREHLKLTGTKVGCGIGQCGACTVHLDGVAIRSCLTPLSRVGDRAITTIEGLSPDRTHPLQKAWIAEQTSQCGYCQSGQIMQAAALLKANPHPTQDEIVKAMTNICRCGTYSRILCAIQKAAADTKAPSAAEHVSAEIDG